MKNLFRFMMAVAILFTASCAKEDISSSIANGETVEVTFSANLPELGTRAYGDGLNANVVYVNVYEANTDNLLSDLTRDEGYSVANNQAKVNIVLIKGMKYDIVFWAQDPNCECYELVGKVVTVDYDGANANDNSRDAFYAYVAGFDPIAPNGKDQVKLYRPFAQLNALTNDFEVVDNNGIDVTTLTSSVVVKNAYQTLNIADGTVSNPVKATFAATQIPAKNGEQLVGKENYDYLSMNYVLVNAKELVEVDFTFKANRKNNGPVITFTNTSYDNVPLQRNYRTNILGALLTKPTEFNVEIKPGFDGDHNSSVIVPEDGKLETLITNEVYAQETAQIILESDVTWTTGAGIGSTPLIPEGAALMDLVIEGGVASRAEEQPVITFVGNGVGAVRAANGGTITFRNVKIVDQSVSYAENNWEYGYLEFGGNLKFENCTFVNAIMVEGQGANASFTNCYFNSNKENEYALWVSAGNVSVKNSTIEGWRGFKTHEAYGSEVVSVAIDNCDFTLTKKPGLAIGDLNAETAISIKNSTFNTQAGDQGLYIYETDTDVTTFNFTLENNKLATSTNEGLNNICTKDGATVVLLSGEYTLPAGIGDNVVIEGAEGAEVIINAPKAANLGSSNLTFRNVTINKSNSNYNGFQHANILTYEDCVINNQIFLYGVKETFTRCTFNQTSSDEYNVWTYGAKEVVFNDCIFNSAGKSVLVYTETLNQVATVTLNGCTLNASTPVEGKAAIEIDSSFPTGGNGSYVVAINNTTAVGFAAGNKSGESLWNNKKGTKTSVVIDGVEVLANGMECVAAGVTLAEGVYYINSVAGMYWVANQVNVAKNAFNGVTVKLAANIDLNNSVWEPIGQTGATTFLGVFDGQNYTISNLNINSDAQTGAYYSSGLFGWVETHAEGKGLLKNVKINGANVVGHHNCGALVGYITEKYAVVENCHVANATISCTYANGDADGDKAGALIGNATNATKVNGCTATDSTISAGRDSGQLIGAASEANVTNCSATNVTVTANGTGTGKNIRNEVVGRAL